MTSTEYIKQNKKTWRGFYYSFVAVIFVSLGFSWLTYPLVSCPEGCGFFGIFIDLIVIVWIFFAVVSGWLLFSNARKLDSLLRISKESRFIPYIGKISAIVATVLPLLALSILY